LQDYSEDLMKPRDYATASELAIYFDKLEQQRGSEIEGDEVLKYCADRGYLNKRRFSLEELSEELETRRVRRPLGPFPQSTWGWFASADVPGYIDRCPRYLGRMDKRSGVAYTFPSYCGSLRCWTNCSLPRAEDILLRACRVYRSCERVWYAVAPWDGGLTNRLSQRQSRKTDRGGLLWLHRCDDDLVHIFSSQDIGGRVEPSRGSWLTSSEALQMLVSTTLALPGPQSHRFTGSWTRPSKPKKEATTFDLGETPPDLLEDALEAANRELNELHDLKSDDLTTDEVEHVWLPLVEGEIQAQWSYRHQSGDEVA
jgi:hypothetical protein